MSSQPRFIYFSYLIGFLLLSMLLIGFHIKPAYSTTAADARNFVDSLGKEVLAVINDGSDDTQKQDKFRELFAQNVAIDWMGHFALGRGGQQASEQELDSYIKVYREYMLARYTNSFSDYIGANYSILEIKPASDNQFIVSLVVKSNQGNDIAVGYRLRPESSNSFKVTDIIVEGVSQITTQRAEFSGVVQQKGVAELTRILSSKSK